MQGSCFFFRVCHTHMQDSYCLFVDFILNREDPWLDLRLSDPKAKDSRNTSQYIYLRSELCEDEWEIKLYWREGGIGTFLLVWMKFGKWDDSERNTKKSDSFSHILCRHNDWTRYLSRLINWIVGHFVETWTWLEVTLKYFSLITMHAYRILSETKYW